MYILNFFSLIFINFIRYFVCIFYHTQYDMIHNKKNKNKKIDLQYNSHFDNYDNWHE